MLLQNRSTPLSSVRRKITAQQQFYTDTIIQTSKGPNVLLLAPIVEAKKGTRKIFQELKQMDTQGLTDVEIINLSATMKVETGI